MKSVMQSKFASIENAEIPRSSFDRTSGHKTTFNAGELIPFYVDEVLPGDTFNLKTTAFARLATPIKPIMDNMHMETFFFFVPTRQVWENWEKFNGEQTDPGDSTDFLTPQIVTSAGWTENSLADHFGIPTGIANLSVNSLPFRCYWHIYNNWFRDQNLIDSLVFTTGDGPDTAINTNPQRRRKRKDYITSALPFPQKGTPIMIPLGDAAPIVAVAGTAPGTPLRVGNADTPANIWDFSPTSPVGFNATIAGSSFLEADLSAATGISINDLRQSVQIQKLLERDARGGTRYPEILLSHWGIRDPQMLVLQRPEFLGGGSSPININPVQQTSETDTNTPQGNLSGFGTVTLRNHGFTKSFTEHGYIIGIVNVRADITYQQDLERLWTRKTRFDHYWPALSHIGEQVVRNDEVMCQGTAADEDVFGYMPRYDEYRFKQSRITGQFRSAFAQSLDVWHLSQEFATLPVLGETFIEDNPPIDRVIAVPSEPQFLFDSIIQLRCARVIPTYGTPGLMDHF